MQKLCINTVSAVEPYNSNGTEHVRLFPAPIWCNLQTHARQGPQSMLKNDYAKVRNLSVFKHGTLPAINIVMFQGEKIETQGYEFKS
ncbi:hypothetical protein GCM10010982_23340 [Bowmanella pacifica]|uniref:Uncharacterized protein n=1 Tax=Bowmanella pacifica TaxID=502051 RepID=A0A917Z1D1_9ALTE|nr:hypothetical protein GCM10010982_23340 [Bowmanella pacifica]